MFFYKKLIIVLSLTGVIFLLMHEFDAFRKREWRMFGLMGRLTDEMQSVIFLSAHIPLLLFIFYYLFTVMFFRSIAIWIVVNSFLILHFAIHLIATGWKSNVFNSIYSFFFIGGGALAGLVNLCLVSYY